MESLSEKTGTSCFPTIKNNTSLTAAFPIWFIWLFSNSHFTVKTSQLRTNSFPNNVAKVVPTYQQFIIEPMTHRYQDLTQYTKQFEINQIAQEKKSVF